MSGFMFMSSTYPLTLRMTWGMQMGGGEGGGV
jgi:hypothetical protein